MSLLLIDVCWRNDVLNSYVHASLRFIHQVSGPVSENIIYTYLKCIQLSNLQCFYRAFDKLRAGWPPRSFGIQHYFTIGRIAMTHPYPQCYIFKCKIDLFLCNTKALFGEWSDIIGSREWMGVSFEKISFHLSVLLLVDCESIFELHVRYGVIDMTITAWRKMHKFCCTVKTWSFTY
jgi:hypothetical protein